LNIFDCSAPNQAVKALELVGYNSTDVSGFKEDLLSLINTQRDCNPKVLTKTVQVPVTTVQKVPIYIPQKPEVIIKEISRPTDCKCNLPDLSKLEGCIIPSMIESLDISNQCSRADVLSFKQTLLDITTAQKRCTAKVSCPPPPPPKVLTKQVPVYIYLKSLKS
jgi:hypothetical protein